MFLLYLSGNSGVLIRTYSPSVHSNVCNGQVRAAGPIKAALGLAWWLLAFYAGLLMTPVG